MSTLKIIIKGEYFDQIKAGTKKIEYRDITPFWTSRLYNNGKKESMIILSLSMAIIKMLDE
jgi:hypothetical protein